MPYAVYSITNSINEKRYIGSTLRADKRFREHRGALRYQRHVNKHLQRSWNEYGETSFCFEVIASSRTSADALATEKALIRQFKSNERPFGYNILTEPGRGTLGFVQSQESRAKMSASKRRDAKLIERLVAMNKSRAGKAFSPEHRARLSATKIGNSNTLGRVMPESERARRRGWSHTVETRAAMSATRLGKPKSAEHRAKLAARLSALNKARAGIPPGDTHRSILRAAHALRSTRP